MTDDDITFSQNTEPEPETNAYGLIKDQKTENGADMYMGMENAHMSFTGIGCLEAVSGDIVLRGRAGQRDVLFPLERAVQRYFEWMAMVQAYARNGIAGWDTMMDIAQDFKAKIGEALAQRKKMGLDIPADAEKLCGISQSKPQA